ncbi:MAG: tRNA preQ1(34) S-adenosylmethionine ribosyltransferase-isomerase QueA [Candidatus Izemoplasma sp.]|nr:tRNA preQ1(34) S-adenosylmethionine ribosyltransferase-isomerase QueA [Candidatus Izemoplasma sp.]
MKLEDFNYELPDNLIAQTPLKNRSDSRLMVLDKTTGNTQHDIFSNILSYLKKDDVLVLNNTSVIPARLFGTKEATGASIEVLLLEQKHDDLWECLVRKAKKIKVGTLVTFGDGRLKAECVAVHDQGIREFKMLYDGVFYEILEALGEMPLPPYIHEKLEDPDRYQTVYSKVKGSAAAPTAGLHFTKELLNELETAGITIVHVTLHVGLGTFRPVSVDNIKEHKMHEEYYHMSQVTADILNKAKQNNQRIVAVGTTSLRTLETIIKKHDKFIETSGYSDIFIYPGYDFQAIDALITNFHLPKSTLLMLVSALASKDIIMNAYQEAIKRHYRFFSFGDSMLIT